MTQPFPDDSIERARRYSAEEKQELERQLGEMTSTEPTQPIPPTDVDLVAEVLARHESRYPGSAAADVVDALARAGRLLPEGAETRTEEIARTLEWYANHPDTSPIVADVLRWTAELARCRLCPDGICSAHRGAPSPTPSIEETPRVE